MSNNMNDLIQTRVQEETGLPWKIDDVYWLDDKDGKVNGIIKWSYEHSIGPDDDPNDEGNTSARVHYTVCAQSNMTSPTELYALRLERNGMELLSTLLGFFGM